MVIINKVYTRNGDSGMTHLAAGQRVPKSSLRMEALGTLDEVNSHLGLTLELLRQEQDNQEVLEILEQITRTQHELFDLGAMLAMYKEDTRNDTPRIDMRDIHRLEQEIDKMNEELPMLTSFILPGGGELSARLHHARTVCRRAERDMMRLFEEEDSQHGTELPYINRLSDWLFVLARFAAMKKGETENLWTQGARKKQ